MSVKITAAEFLALSPVMWVAVGAITVLLGDLFLRGRSKTPLAYIALTALGIAGYFMSVHWAGAAETVLLGGAVSVSVFGSAVGAGLLIAAGLTALSAAQYGRGSAVATGEFYGLVMFATAGGLVLVIANDFVTFFVALETMSLSVYALTGIARQRSTSAEGGMKYFIMGAVASGFLLYGIALLYGATGTMQFLPSAPGSGSVEALAAGVAPLNKGGLALAGVVCLLVGILFKIGAAPFHGWVADAYQGAPAPTTGFMSVAVKAAAFAAFLKVVIALGRGVGGPLVVTDALWVIAALTMIVGNFGALVQKSPKRILAYSGIAHSGYGLIAIVAVAAQLERGAEADAGLLSNASASLLFYLLAYAVTNLAAFALLGSLERRGEDAESLDDLAGMARRAPLGAFAMMVAMISLAGVPLTGGFTAKLWVFQAGLKQGLTVLVLLGLVTSIVSFYYYLRIVIVMYMSPPPAEAGESGAATRWTARFAMVAGAGATLALGIIPGPAMELISDGAAALFKG